jgi:hypothetical protein
LSFHHGHGRDWHFFQDTQIAYLQQRVGDARAVGREAETHPSDRPEVGAKRPNVAHPFGCDVDGKKKMVRPVLIPAFESFVEDLASGVLEIVREEED